MLDGLMMILVVNAGIFAFYLIMRKKFHALFNKRGYMGYYMVLLPIGFSAWDDPILWFVVGLALIGLVVISFAAQNVIDELRKEEK